MTHQTTPEISPLTRVEFGRVSVYFGAQSGKYPDGNQVIIRGTEVHAAFDTPIVSNFIGAELDQAELVILGHVHEDHMAGLHRLPDAQVHVHEGDVAAARSWHGMRQALGLHDEVAAGEALIKLQREFHYQPRPDALSYTDGATWQLGASSVRAFHMPGHTSGHCVLLVEPEGVAFIGDIDLTGFGPYYGDPTSNLRDFRNTLTTLADIPARVWVTSHHRGVYTDRDKFLLALARFAARIDEREQRLITLLRESPKTLAQLVACRLLYPPNYSSSWVNAAEARTISQHLEELMAAGRVRGDEDGHFHLTP